MGITRRRLLQMTIRSAIAAASMGLMYACGKDSPDNRRSRGTAYDTKGKGDIMMNPARISRDFKEKLVMKHSPVGFYFSDTKPEGAVAFKKPISGCIMPRILASAKGSTYAFDEKSLPSCAAFFLGFRDGLFTGAEYFLSHAPLAGSLCERFVKTPKLAREYIRKAKYPKKSKGHAVFKPLEQFTGTDKPEIVIFFANPDQLSALVYLLYFGAPLEGDRVATGFSSGCGSVVAMPLAFRRSGAGKAVWGLHDVSARANLPADLMTIALPYELLVEIWKDMDKSFLITKTWNKIAGRIARNNKVKGGKNTGKGFDAFHSGIDTNKKCDACH